MMLVRLASSFLFIESENTHTIRKRISNEFSTTLTTLERAMHQGTEDSTIIIFRNRENPDIPITSDETVVAVNSQATQVLTHLFHLPGREEIRTIHSGPQMVIMRYAENGEDVLESITRDYPDAKKINWYEGFQQGRKQNTTLLGLTPYSLSKVLTPEDFLPDLLLIPQPPIKVLKALRNDALVYVTHTMEETQWRELKITIYDSEENIPHHYERLVHAFSALDVGFIIGESWTKDHPFVMITILAYQITLFSLLEPYEIKKILLALECGKNGNRLVDLDLYHKNKKVSWTHNQIKHLGKNRDEIAEKCREELQKQIPEHWIWSE